MRQKPYYKCYEQTRTNTQRKNNVDDKNDEDGNKNTNTNAIHPLFDAVPLTQQRQPSGGTGICGHWLSLFNRLVFNEYGYVYSCNAYSVCMWMPFWKLINVCFCSTIYSYGVSFVLVCAPHMYVWTSGAAYVCVLHYIRSKSSCTIKANH